MGGPESVTLYRVVPLVEPWLTTTTKVPPYPRGIVSTHEPLPCTPNGTATAVADSAAGSPPWPLVDMFPRNVMLHAEPADLQPEQSQPKKVSPRTAEDGRMLYRDSAICSCEQASPTIRWAYPKPRGGRHGRSDIQLGGVRVDYGHFAPD